MIQNPLQRIDIQRHGVEGFYTFKDWVVSEEPLELRIIFESEGLLQEKSVAVTMRTPNTDHDLGLGFLLTEGIINYTSEVEKLFHCPNVSSEAQGNVLKIVLKRGVLPNFLNSERHLYISSSCGICSKASLEQVRLHCSRPVVFDKKVSHQIILSLAERLRDEQLLFAHTGGLHAAAIFEPNGDLLFMREDIGRHNAVDKVIGAFFQEHTFLENKILFLSGRAGFELLQKAVLAGFGMVVAVGAPSSLSVELANSQNVTLIGFLKKEQFNVYTHAERLG